MKHWPARRYHSPLAHVILADGSVGKSRVPAYRNFVTGSGTLFKPLIGAGQNV